MNASVLDLQFISTGSDQYQLSHVDAALLDVTKSIQEDLPARARVLRHLAVLSNLEVFSLLLMKTLLQIYEMFILLLLLIDHYHWSYANVMSLYKYPWQDYPLINVSSMQSSHKELIQGSVLSSKRSRFQQTTMGALLAHAAKEELHTDVCVINGSLWSLFKVFSLFVFLSIWKHLYCQVFLFIWLLKRCANKRWSRLR